jgi:hypothetical protein
MLAAEVTREKLMLRLHQEIPYQLTVETETWEKIGKGGIGEDRQLIHVSREGHRSIVLGKGGQTDQGIGTASRKELTEMLGNAGSPVPAREGLRTLAGQPRALHRHRPRLRRLTRPFCLHRTSPFVRQPALANSR